LRSEKSGDIGSYNARANAGLKNAETLNAPLEQTKSESKRAVVAAAPSAQAAVNKQLDDIEQQTRVVQGKSFFQNGTQWIDTAAQNAKAEKRQRIQFASDEYFDLLAKNADAAQWLALGRNVQFTLGDTLYEIVE
jgi:hypothetical protein